MAGRPAASSTCRAYATCQRFEAWFAPERDVESVLKLLHAVEMKAPADSDTVVNSDVKPITGAVAVKVAQQGASSQQVGRHASCWVLALLWEGVQSSSRPTSSDVWTELNDAMKAVQ
jgi:hypothetical protein